MSLLVLQRRNVRPVGESEAVPRLRNGEVKCSRGIHQCIPKELSLIG